MIIFIIFYFFYDFFLLNDFLIFSFSPIPGPFPFPSAIGLGRCPNPLNQTTRPPCAIRFPIFLGRGVSGEWCLGVTMGARKIAKTKRVLVSGRGWDNTSLPDDGREMRPRKAEVHESRSPTRRWRIVDGREPVVMVVGILGGNTRERERVGQRQQQQGTETEK